MFPYEDSKIVSVCPYPEKRNHPSVVNISATLVIDTSMETITIIGIIDTLTMLLQVFPLTGPLPDTHHAGHLQEGPPSTPHFHHLWPHLLLLHIFLRGPLLGEPRFRTSLYLTNSTAAIFT